MSNPDELSFGELLDGDPTFTAYDDNGELVVYPDWEDVPSNRRRGAASAKVWAVMITGEDPEKDRQTQEIVDGINARRRAAAMAGKPY